MVLYVDSLVFVNTIIDYFLLLLTGFIVKRTYVLKRTVLAAVFGGFSSLYLLVEGTSFFLDILFKIVSGGIILIISQKFKRFKDFSITYFVFMLLNFTIAGIIEFFNSIKFTSVFMSNNLMSYINISPLLLICLTIAIYLLVTGIKKYIDRHTLATLVRLKIYLCGLEFDYSAIVDSGHMLIDPFSNSQVFILDVSKYNLIKEIVDGKEYKKRNRLIPASTVGTAELLEGIRCDRADVCSKESTYIFSAPIVVASAIPLDCDADAIVSSLVFKRIND